MFLHDMRTKSLGRGMYMLFTRGIAFFFVTALTVFRCCRWSMRLGKCFGKTSLPTS